MTESSSKKFIICPGVVKAGTTTLYEILKHNSEICVSKKKETRYFLRDGNNLSIEEYSNLYFNPRSSRQYLADIDPNYLYFSDSEKKFHDILGDNVKFIILLRNPVDRAYSHYWMSKRKGFETESFATAIKLEKDRLKKHFDESRWIFSYLDRGYYYRQIKHYLRYFSIKNMYFILFDDFKKNQQKVMIDLMDYLGIQYSDSLNETNKISNSGKIPKSQTIAKILGQPFKFKKSLRKIKPLHLFWENVFPYLETLNRSKQKYPPLDIEIKKQLNSVFSEDVEKLSNLINKDFSHWTVI